MILSVSRRTDVPNYYSDWFFNRIKEGHLFVRNPMNAHQVSKIVLSPDVVDCIVFWTKNPSNMLDKLDELKNYKYYFQFTLTSYGKDIEPNLPHKKYELLPIFRALSEKIGKERVIWRYDPIFLSERYTVEYHLNGYTEKVIVSFLDFYPKIQKNMVEQGMRQLSEEDMRSLAVELVKISKKNNLLIESCAEKIDLQDIGISHGSCIDKALIERIVGYPLKGSKDNNQRTECGCFESVEVGTYNTCLNGCKYCYANLTDEKIRGNMGLYDVDSPILCGRIEAKDKVTDRKVSLLKQK